MSDSSTAELQREFRATLLRRTNRTPKDPAQATKEFLRGNFMSTSNTISKIGAVFHIICEGFAANFPERRLNEAPHPGFDLIGAVNTSAFHRTNVEFGEHWSLSALA